MYSPGDRFGQEVAGRNRRVEVVRGEDKAADESPLLCSHSMEKMMPEEEKIQESRLKRLKSDANQ